MSTRVAIVILNWNSWRDTLECLESVFRLTGPSHQIIVCDNASSDGSPEQIKAWAAGRVAASPRSADPRMRAFSNPPVPKPIPLEERHGDHDAAPGLPGAEPARLILIHTGANLGFAGGNNVGMRYALAREFDFVWLLNNDTVADPKALEAMTDVMNSAPDAGICGSQLRYYDAPDTIQALGGARYDPILGIPRHLGVGRKTTDVLPPASEIESAMSYVVGASMLVSRAFLRDVGLMAEEYFLYFEELDWAERARGRYTQRVALESIVYHKEGASIGTSRVPGGDSVTSDYYRTSNRLRFTKKHRPWLLPVAWAGVFVAMLNRVRRGQWSRAVMIAAILVGAGVPPSGSPRP